MQDQKKSSGLGLLTIAAFIGIALIGLFITFKVANGSTAIGLAGGVVTVAAAWFGARWVNLRG